MLYGLWVVMLLVIWPTSSHAMENKNNPSAQEELTGVQKWVFSTSNECPGSETVCKTWINFREKHPWPYQSFAIAPGASDEEAVVIISEPPPVITRTEMIALVRNTFGSDLLDISQFRWPTGLDGWLEDTVMRVRIVPEVEQVSVIRGHTFSTWEVPAPIIDRLSYIHFVFHQTADGFYVDQLYPSADLEIGSRLQDVQISPADIQYWLGDDNLLWRSLDPDDPSNIQWGKLRLGRVSGVFASSGNDLVAFIVPRKSHLNDLAIPFRRFAVSTDLLLTAIQTKNGGMILIGRNRHVPFSVLPPLRFETFSSFAANPTKGIYQSYERQRMFSGKILDGEHKGWDWAPIYLSAHLDNTEFGTLLNQADQILKSWSESGLVRYKTFDYPDPDDFPFDDEPASEYFARLLGSESLIFNWNTHGFSTITELSMGNVLTANRSGSLPVLYITGSTLHRPLQEGRTSKETEALKQLQRLIERHRKRVEADAGDRAYQYFAEAEDPILVRVVQNVFLYQAVTNFLNLTTDNKHKGKEASLAKSEATSRAIRQEAERWLKNVVGKGVRLEGNPIAKAVGELLHRPGMTQAKLAEYLATPQAATRRLLQIERERRKLAAQLEPLQVSYYQAHLQARDAFEEYCMAVEQNGGRRYSSPQEDPETGEKTPGTACEIKAARIPKTVQNSRERYRALNQEVKKQARVLKPIFKTYQTTTAQVESLDEEFRMVDEISRIVASEASFTADLDHVLNRVLEATSRIQNEGAIQTPTVVLSQNRREYWAIGGHNIESASLRARISPKIDLPKLEGAPGKASLVIPADKLSKVNRFAQDVEHGNPLEDGKIPIVPERDLVAALHIESERKMPGTILETMRNVSRKSLDEDALAQRAEKCMCDVYVQRVDGEVVRIVRNQPPPPAKHTVVGSGSVVETLARIPTRGTVHFVGFDTRAVVGLSKSVEIAVQRSKGGSSQPRVKQWIESALKLFSNRNIPQDGAVVKIRTPSGSHVPVHISGNSVVLGSKPDWRNATIQALPEGSQERLAQIGHERSFNGATDPAVVEVRFSSDAEQAEIESIHILAEMPAGKAIEGEGRMMKVFTSFVANRSYAKGTLERDIGKLADKIWKALGPKEIMFFVRNSLGDIREAKREVIANEPGSS